MTGPLPYISRALIYAKDHGFYWEEDKRRYLEHIIFYFDGKTFHGHGITRDEALVDLELLLERYGG